MSEVTQDKFKGLYFARPINVKKFHIFKDGRSLCKKWMMFKKDPEQCTDLKGTETLGREDCKPCFLKAGLKINE